MKYALSALTTVLSVALWVSSSGAQGPIVYPAKGQSPEQQNKDKGECYVWAVQQSGFDPAKTQPAASPPTQPPTGERARGPAAKKQEQAQQQAQKEQQAKAQQQQQATAQAQSNYNKAVAACLEGRGYTVK